MCRRSLAERSSARRMAETWTQHSRLGNLPGGLMFDCRAALLTVLLLSASVPALATRLLSSAAAPGSAASAIDGITTGISSTRSDARFACASDFRWVVVSSHRPQEALVIFALCETLHPLCWCMAGVQAFLCSPCSLEQQYVL